jgi:hypothetical protein
VMKPYWKLQRIFWAKWVGFCMKLSFYCFNRDTIHVTLHCVNFRFYVKSFRLHALILANRWHWISSPRMLCKPNPEFCNSTRPALLMLEQKCKSYIRWRILTFAYSANCPWVLFNYEVYKTAVLYAKIHKTSNITTC